MLLGKVASGCIFLIVLLSYSAQSEIAQQIQRTYKKPYFLLYLTHSGYMLIGVLHLLAIRLLRIDANALRTRLHEAISAHCDFRESTSSWAATEDEGYAKTAGVQTTPWRALRWPYLRMIMTITVSITAPALSWYCAVPLTSMTDITSLYNSNAFWAYLLAIYLTKTEKMEWRKGCAVVLACFGVVIIAYGDSQTSSSEEVNDFGSRLAGSLLALFGSVTYALYEVYYSRFVALNDVPLATVAVGTPSITLRHARSYSGRPLMSSPRHSRKSYSGLRGEDDEGTDAIEVGTRSPESPMFRLPPHELVSDQAVYIAYANLVTASIGVCTLSLLWIPIPLLHISGIEMFELPPRATLLPIAGVVLCGVAYNAGFMILLGEWGPIIASVGNLCTLVLVAAADIVLVGARLTFWTLTGSAFIVGAFAVLAIDALRTS